MSKVQVDVDPKTIDNFFGRLDVALDDVADQIFTLSQDKVSVDRGMLKKSGTVTRRFLHKVIGYDSPEAPWIEFGTDPHTPPLAPILAWVTRKAGVSKSQIPKVANAIRWSISKHGTEPHPFLRPAFDDVEMRAKTIILRHFR